MLPCAALCTHKGRAPTVQFVCARKANDELFAVKLFIYLIYNENNKTEINFKITTVDTQQPE